MEKLRRNITITFAGYSNMTCACVRRIAPSQGVKSNSTDRSLTWENQKVSARWSIYWDGLVRVPLHPRLRYDYCSTTTVNQERHAMAVGDEQQRAFDKLKDSLLSELCMQPGCAKSNDTARNQVIDGEGHSALGTYQGHWEWPVDTFRSTRVQKYETWTIGLPRNFTEGKQDLSPKSSERQSRGPCTGWTLRTVKTKRRIRGKVWFSGVDNVVKEEVDNCLPCQAATKGKAERLKPLKTTTLPSAPWKELALDFVRPLRSGEYLTVATNEYSRIPEAEIVASTSAGSTIQKLDAIFARQGIPHVLKSDNGPPSMAWNSRTFASIWAFDTAKKRLFGQDQWRRGMFHDDTSEMHESRHRWAQKLETITLQVSLTVSGDTPLNYWHHTVQST